MRHRRANSKRSGIRLWSVVAIALLAAVLAGGILNAPRYDWAQRAISTAYYGGVVDLAVTKTDSPDPVIEDNNLTYTVTVTNNGPDFASNVSLADPLPPGTTFVSVSPQPDCFFDSESGSVFCNFSRIDVGSPVTVTIVVRPYTSGTVVNTASVSGGDFDPDTSNNSATENTTVLAHDYAFSLAPPSATNPVGTTHTVTATLTDNGQPLPNETILFDVTGANPTSGSSPTNGSGQATFSYQGNNVGSDTIRACWDRNGDSFCSQPPCDCSPELTATATKEWAAYGISLSPPSATNNTLTTHTVTATVALGTTPIADARVLFSVTGVNPTGGIVHTDVNGNASFTYTGLYAGEDTITACFDRNRNGVCDSREPSATATKEWIPQCANGLDDDGDGRIDYPADPGCSSTADPNEADVTACTDGIDNDNDRTVDFPNDLGCSSRDDPTETFENPAVTPGGGGGGGGGSGGGSGGAVTVSPPGGTSVQVVPAHFTSHARFRVAYGRVVRAHGRRYLVLRVNGRHAGRVRLRIRLTYRHTRMRSVTRTVRTNRRVRLTGLDLAGIRRVQLTLLG